MSKSPSEIESYLDESSDEESAPMKKDEKPLTVGQIKKNQKYRNLLPFKFSDKSDDLLVKLAEKSKKNWKHMQNIFLIHFPSFKVPTRAQLENRLNVIAGVSSEKTNTPPFTEKEKLLIFELNKQYPRDWMKIAEKFPGRTPLQIKNAYYVVAKKQSNQSAFFTPQVDTQEEKNDLQKEPLKGRLTCPKIVS